MPLKERSLYGDLGDGEHPAAIHAWRELFSPSTGMRLLKDCIVRWWQSRMWPLALPAIPAVAAIVAVLVIGMMHYDPSHRNSIRTIYEQQLGIALQAKEWTRARVVCDALLAKMPNEHRYLFHRALIAFGQEQNEMADQLFKRLVPLNASGYPIARRIIAGQLIKQGHIDEAKLQLETAVREAPNDDELKISLGRLLIVAGDAQRGIELMEPIAGDRGELRFDIGQWYAARGLTSESQRNFRMAANSFENSWRSSHREREAIFAADAWRFCNDIDRAEKILREALQSNEATAAVREGLGRCLVTRAREFADQARPLEQWRLLEQALAMAPNNPEVLAQICKLAFGKGEASDAANLTIDALIASGQTPTIIHLIFGTRAAQSGDFAKASLHLKQAVAQNPQAPVILNNLAWVLAHQAPPQLEQARNMIDEAIKLAPQTADILDTRGTIRLKQNDPMGAITDLENALKLRPGYIPYRKQLAEAYRAAGDQEAAARIEATLSVLKE